jgi:flagellar basal-body rod protein FlgG
LKLNAKGMLCTNDDALVLGSKGKPISLGSGKISIGADGSVALNGAAVDKLKIVSFKDIRNLVREGNSLFMVPDGKDQEKPSSAAIKSGYLESSNVNPVSSMIRMMSVLRQFESIQKTVNLVLNDMDVKSIDKLGR